MTSICFVGFDCLHMMSTLFSIGVLFCVHKQNYHIIFKYFVTYNLRLMGFSCVGSCVYLHVFKMVTHESVCKSEEEHNGWKCHFGVKKSFNWSFLVCGPFSSFNY